MTQQSVKGGNQPMTHLLIFNSALLRDFLRRLPRRLEPAKLEPSPTQKGRAGWVSLKHAGFSKASKEVGHLSRLAKLCRANYVHAAQVFFPIGKPDWALSPLAIPIGKPDWALPASTGTPGSGQPETT
eukprot:6463509-Amphidinium_carterae.2